MENTIMHNMPNVEHVTNKQEEKNTQEKKREKIHIKIYPILCIVEQPIR
jgi:hypothetical protein